MSMAPCFVECFLREILGALRIARHPCTEPYQPGTFAREYRFQFCRRIWLLKNHLMLRSPDLPSICTLYCRLATAKGNAFFVLAGNQTNRHIPGPTNWPDACN